MLPIHKQAVTDRFKKHLHALMTFKMTPGAQEEWTMYVGALTLWNGKNSEEKLPEMPTSPSTVQINKKCLGILSRYLPETREGASDFAKEQLTVMRKIEDLKVDWGSKGILS